MTQLWRDIVHALRVLQRSPGFASMAALAFAFGIGANTAIYSVAHVLVLQPLSVPHLDRLVTLSMTPREAPESRRGLSPADFLEWKKQLTTLDSLSAIDHVPVNVTGDGNPQPVNAYCVSADFFEALGTQPVQGRALYAADEQPGAEPVVVISDRFWKAHGGANLLGNVLELDGRPHTIVGIMPREFRYPTDAEIWLPMMLGASEKYDRTSFRFAVVAMLKQKISIAQASDEVRSRAHRLSQEYPNSHGDLSARVELLRDSISGNLTTPLTVLLMGSSGLLLLLACANVANLQFARVSSRSREIAIRAVLGATRSRLLNQFLVESVLLSAFGAALGSLMALWAVRLLRQSIPVEVQQHLPGWERLGLNGHVMLFTLAVSAISGIVAGLAPALVESRTDLTSSLREVGRSFTAGIRRARLRNIFVVVQIGLSLVLLVGSALVAQGLRVVNEPAPNLEPENAVLFQLSLPATRYPDQQKRWLCQEQLLARVLESGPAESVALVRDVPYSGESNSVEIEIEGREEKKHRRLTVQDQITSAGYFQTLGLPLIAGRDFSLDDRETTRPVAVISRALAKRYFPGEDPIGKRVRISRQTSDMLWTTIIGVSGDVHTSPFEKNYPFILYRPAAQSGPNSFAVLVRTKSSEPSSPGRLRADIRSALMKVDRDLPVSDITTLRQFFDNRELAVLRFVAGLLGIFAILSLVLASLGVYGIMARGVAERRQEFAVRMALGADARMVIRMVMGGGASLAGIGLAIGTPLAFAFGQTLAGFLFGVQASNLAAYCTGVAVLTLTCLVACFVPAFGIVRTDPMHSLKSDGSR
jgi:putative ABC transport system permease protein